MCPRPGLGSTDSAQTPIAGKWTGGLTVVRLGDLSPSRPERKHSRARLLVAERGSWCHGHTPLTPEDRGLTRANPAGIVVAGPGSLAASKAPGTARQES